jgi:phytoene/squalene synthetase
MLRDLVVDVDAGYVNVPSEVLAEPGASLDDLHGPAMRAWVRDRVELARSCFAVGRRYLAQVEDARCRLAGHAYTARFEWVLDAIEQDGYRLRAGYPERATVRGGLRIAADAARSALAAGRRAELAAPAGAPAGVAR